MVNINCKAYLKGFCTHQAAPRKLFGKQLCLLEYKPDDARIMDACALQVKYPKPTPPPKTP